jgi:hypothetical protein
MLFSMGLPQLFLVYVLTIIATRVILKLWPQHTGKVAGFQPHHYMFGVLLLLVYLFYPWNALIALGLALIVDEIPLFFIFKTWDWPDDHWKQYHSWASIWSIVAISLVGYVFFIYFL